MGGKVQLYRWRAQTRLQCLNVGGYMHRFDVLQFSQSIIPTPGGELHCGPGVDLTRVRVTNVGSEELNEAFACIWAGCEQRRQAKVSVTRRKFSGMVNRQVR